MITPTQVSAESMTPALTDVQIMGLELLVQQYDGYYGSPGLYSDLHDVLSVEMDTPTIKTQYLKAVLKAVDALPEIVAESEGTDKATTFFSVKGNWDALARDVLNLLYPTVIYPLTQSYLVVQRKIKDLKLRGDYY